MTGRWEGSKRLARPFTDKRSRRLLAAFLVSELGDGITAVVVPLGVYALSDSVIALASTFLGRMLAGTLFAAAGGAIADFTDRRRLLLASYAVRAVLVAVLIPLPGTNPAAFAVIGVIVGAAGSFDNPAAESALRTSYKHDLQSLAAARKSGKTVSQMVGPAVGGLLFGLGGLTLALGINVLTFVLALTLLAPRQSMPAAGRKAAGGRKAKVKSSSGTPAPKGRFSPVVTMSFFSAASASFLVAVGTVLAVPYLAGLPNAPDGAYGFALSAYGIGALVGLWAAGVTSWSTIRLKSVLVFSAVAFGIITALSVSVPRWEVFAAAWFIWGIAFGPEDVLSDARVASIVSDGWLARVYALWSIMGKLGAAGGYVLVIAISGLAAQSALQAIGLLYALFIPIVLMCLRREPRNPAG
ncbi:MFS transporter [Arthrobacter sp. H14]|uniref:MFS transporter n=1 Tax=Arthrobacter sp. H14 TaxID=1312959 RepID=UPI0004798F8B|nr:MFS transporter [Arthrobacter sp. H14]